jgi:hypothetical protein
MFGDVDGQAIKNVCNHTQKGIYGALSLDFEQLSLL